MPLLMLRERERSGRKEAADHVIAKLTGVLGKHDLYPLISRSSNNNSGGNNGTSNSSNISLINSKINIISNYNSSGTGIGDLSENPSLSL